MNQGTNWEDPKVVNKYSPKPVSSCCSANVGVVNGDEGTNYYACGKCGRACDGVPPGPVDSVRKAEIAGELKPAAPEGWRQRLEEIAYRGEYSGNRDGRAAMGDLESRFLVYAEAEALFAAGLGRARREERERAMRIMRRRLDSLDADFLALLIADMERPERPDAGTGA